MKIFIKICLASLVTGCINKQNITNTISNAQWIDLTYSFDSSTLYWPNNPLEFNHLNEFMGRTPLGYFYSSYSISTPEHGGTHLDAPIHFAEGRKTADEIPLTSLTGEAVIIDVSSRALSNRDYLVSIEDVLEWEKNNGQIPANTIILFRTGYGKFYPDREKYFGTTKKGAEAIPELHFPGIDSSTTRFLVNERDIKALGLDTPSMDYGQSKDFKTHQILLEKNKPGFENVANLDQLPEKGVYIVALPMKIAKGSGAPLRIVATIMH